jgi:DNA-binding transcriptional regulator YiaG
MDIAVLDIVRRIDRSLAALTKALERSAKSDRRNVTLTEKQATDAVVLLRHARTALKEGWSSRKKKPPTTRLEELRANVQLSRAQLAAAMGTSETGILRWERGTVRPSVDNVFKLASALSVAPAVVLEALRPPSV